VRSQADGGIGTRAQASQYGGDPSIALSEAFQREASITLELITKAVIAQRLEVGEDLGVTKVPASYNVPQLWSQAKLPELPRDDYGRLVRARVCLMMTSTQAIDRFNGI
jgi:hypothetical protein